MSVIVYYVRNDVKEVTTESEQYWLAFKGGEWVRYNSLNAALK